MEIENAFYYFADPMCSWCYGFAPEVSAVYDQNRDRFGFHLIMGGLRPHGTETFGGLADMLKHHWKQVAERSGQPFDYSVLDHEDRVYDTEPPCRAVRVMREIKPEAEFEFFKQIQKAFYREGKEMDKIDTYLNLLPELEVDPAQFKEQFESEEMKLQTTYDFHQARDWGITGYPALVVGWEGELFLIAKGFSDRETLFRILDEITIKQKS
ncbi:DsbA family protein [bacterium SCSIO 12741]|nr:DsbA family protein [bacterium SCSIO 12741]